MQPQSQPPQKYIPITYDQLTPQLLEEAISMSKRYDRNLAHKHGDDAFPVPCRTARLMALAILHLNARLQAAEAPQPAARPLKVKAQAGKPAKAKAPEVAPEKPAEPSGPTLTPQQLKAFRIIQGMIADKEVVTSRGVADLGNWGSHNTGARHINNLVDLGYLKRVGKQKVIALTGLEP